MLFGYIVIIKRDGTDGTRYPVTTQTCTIGRSVSSDIRFHVQSISSRHCEITTSDFGPASVENLSDTSSTEVNGVPIGKKSLLGHGDIIAAGERSFRWEYLPDSKYYMSTLTNNDVHLSTSPLHGSTGMVGMPISVLQSALGNRPFSRRSMAVTVSKKKSPSLMSNGRNSARSSAPMPKNVSFTPSERLVAIVTPQRRSPSEKKISEPLSANSSSERGSSSRILQESNISFVTTPTGIMNRSSSSSDANVTTPTGSSESIRQSRKSKTPMPINSVEIQSTPADKSIVEINNKSVIVDSTPLKRKSVRQASKSEKRALSIGAKMFYNRRSLQALITSRTPLSKSKVRKSVSVAFETTTKRTPSQQKTVTKKLATVKTPQSLKETKKSAGSIKKKTPISSVKQIKITSAQKTPIIVNGKKRKLELGIRSAERAAKRLKLESPKTPDKKKMAALLVCHRKTPRSQTLQNVSISPQRVADTPQAGSAAGKNARKKSKSLQKLSKKNSVVKHSYTTEIPQHFNFSSKPSDGSDISKQIANSFVKSPSCNIRRPLSEKELEDNVNMSGISELTSPEAVTYSRNSETPASSIRTQFKQSASTPRTPTSAGKSSTSASSSSILKYTPPVSEIKKTRKSLSAAFDSISSIQLPDIEEAMMSTRRSSTRASPKSPASSTTPRNLSTTTVTRKSTSASSPLQSTGVTVPVGKPTSPISGKTSLKPSVTPSTKSLTPTSDSISGKQFEGSAIGQPMSATRTSHRKKTAVIVTPVRKSATPASGRSLRKMQKTPSGGTPHKKSETPFYISLQHKQTPIGVTTRILTPDSGKMQQKTSLPALVSPSRKSESPIYDSTPNKSTRSATRKSTRSATGESMSASPVIATLVRKSTASARSQHKIRSPSVTPDRKSLSPASCRSQHEITKSSISLATSGKKSKSPTGDSTPVQTTGSPSKKSVSSNTSQHQQTPVMQTTTPSRKQQKKSSVTPPRKSLTPPGVLHLETSVFSDGSNTFDFELSSYASQSCSSALSNISVGSIMHDSSEVQIMVNSNKKTPKQKGRQSLFEELMKKTLESKRTSANTPQSKYISTRKSTIASHGSHDFTENSDTKSSSKIISKSPSAETEPVSVMSRSPITKQTPTRKLSLRVMKQSPQNTDLSQKTKRSMDSMQANLSPYVESNSRIIKSRSISKFSPGKEVKKRSTFSSVKKLSRSYSSPELSTSKSPAGRSDRHTVLDSSSLKGVLSESADGNKIRSSKKRVSWSHTNQISSVSSDTPNTTFDFDSVRTPYISLGDLVSPLSSDRKRNKLSQYLSLSEQKGEPAFKRQRLSERKNGSFGANLNIVASKKLYLSSTSSTNESFSSSRISGKSQSFETLISDNKINISNKTKSPKNDLTDVHGVRQTVKIPRSPKSPKNDLTDARGVRQIMKTPRRIKSPKNDLTDVRGVRQIMKTPRSPKSPKNDLTDVRGVRQIMKTPQSPKSPKNDLTDLRGVRQIMKTPRSPRSPKNDLTDVRGVRQIMKTPRSPKSPKNDLTDVRGVRQIMKTPRSPKSPKNDLTDVRGVRQIMKTPRSPKSPKNDLTDVRGVRQLMKTPRSPKSPKNDLTDIHGVQQLMKTPRSPGSPKNNLTDSGVNKLLTTPHILKSPKNDLTCVHGIDQLIKTSQTPKVARVELSDININRLPSQSDVKRMSWEKIDLDQQSKNTTESSAIVQVQKTEIRSPGSDKTPTMASSETIKHKLLEAGESKTDVHGSQKSTPQEVKVSVRRGRKRKGPELCAMQVEVPTVSPKLPSKIRQKEKNVGDNVEHTLEISASSIDLSNHSMGERNRVRFNIPDSPTSSTPLGRATRRKKGIETHDIESTKTPSPTTEPKKTKDSKDLLKTESPRKLDSVTLGQSSPPTRRRTRATKPSSKEEFSKVESPPPQRRKRGTTVATSSEQPLSKGKIAADEQLSALPKRRRGVAVSDDIELVHSPPKKKTRGKPIVQLLTTMEDSSFPVLSGAVAESSPAVKKRKRGGKTDETTVSPLPTRRLRGIKALGDALHEPSTRSRKPAVFSSPVSKVPSPPIKTRSRKATVVSSPTVNTPSPSSRTRRKKTAVISSPVSKALSPLPKTRTRKATVVPSIILKTPSPPSKTRNKKATVPSPVSKTPSPPSKTRNKKPTIVSSPVAKKHSPMTSKTRSKKTTVVSLSETVSPSLKTRSRKLAVVSSPIIKASPSSKTRSKKPGIVSSPVRKMPSPSSETRTINSAVNLSSVSKTPSPPSKSRRTRKQTKKEDKESPLILPATRVTRRRK